MKKPILISLSVLGLLLVSVAAWGLMTSLSQQSSTDQPASTPTVNRTDLTAETKPTVVIRDLSFTPPNIKIKVGATVTWTNNDGVGHSVVADDASNSGGLPTDAQMFGKDETFSFTFKQAGTFKYHCIPHTFMHGSVEVTE